MKPLSLKELRGIINPLKEYIYYDNIVENVEKTSIEDVIAYLLQYDIKAVNVIKLANKTLYVVEDFASRNNRYVKASNIIAFFYSRTL